MKRTISVIIAAVVALSAAFTAFAGSASAQNAQVLSAVNIEDTVCGNNRCSCTDLRTGETLYPFSYSIDEGEAAVLIFLNGNDCMNSTSLVDQLQEADWITEPGLTMIMVESVSAGMDYDDFTSYYGEIDQSIALYTSDTLMWYYYWLVSDDYSVSTPIVMVVARENGKNMIKHYYTGYTSSYDIERAVSTILPDLGGEETSDEVIEEETVTVDITMTGKRLYSEAYKVFELVNEAREAEGLKPLSYNANLTEMAMRRAAECQAVYSHDRPDGTSCFTIEDEIGYEAGGLSGENIAAEYSNAEYVMDGWMFSDGHRANILSSNDSIGVGAYISNGTITWCQLFATGTQAAPVPTEDVSTEEIIRMRASGCDDFTVFTDKSYTLTVGETIGLDNICAINRIWGSCSYNVNPVVTVQSGGDKIVLDGGSLTVKANSAGKAVLELRTHEGGAAFSKVTLNIICKNHEYGAWEKTSDTRQTRFCSVCGAADDAVLTDYDGTGKITSDDAVYLLRYTLFPEYYPVTIFADLDGSGVVTSDDAVYLLRHTLFPEAYPLPAAFTEGFVYSVKYDGTCTITGIDGFDESYMNIPPQIDGYIVSGIDDYAFQYCSSLTSITIPDSVTSIGDLAFRGCEGLADKDGFVIIRNVLYSYYGGVVAVIPDSVTSIGDNAFYNCSSLTSVTIPDSVTSIGDWAFCNCSSLTSVTIPDSVTSIGWDAFYGCEGLASITIPDSVTSIGGWAFDNCSNLTSVIIADSVTSIGMFAFYGCSSITELTVDKNNPVYHSSGNCIVETKSKTLIAGCNNSVIPNDGSVTSIGDYAFCHCSLTSVTIPDSVTSICEGAFTDCSSLTSVTIPDSVTGIGKFAFCDCSSLTSVTIPDSVTSIDGYAFRGCSSLTGINFTGTKTQWNSISKGEDWNADTGDYIVHCTDGNIKK